MCICLYSLWIIQFRKVSNRFGSHFEYFIQPNSLMLKPINNVDILELDSKSTLSALKYSHLFFKNIRWLGGERALEWECRNCYIIADIIAIINPIVGGKPYEQPYGRICVHMHWSTGSILPVTFFSTNLVQIDNGAMPLYIMFIVYITVGFSFNSNLKLSTHVFWFIRCFSSTLQCQLCGKRF